MVGFPYRGESEKGVIRFSIVYLYKVGLYKLSINIIHMSPLVHGMIAWLFAWLVLRRAHDRRLAVIAGVAMDLDGIFILFDRAQYLDYHHTFTHSYIFAVPIAITAAILAKDRLLTAYAAIMAFTLHLAADVFGSNWAVYPFYPLSDWGVSASPAVSDFVIYFIISPGTFVVCCVLILFIMYRWETSPLEFLSEKWDKRFVRTFSYFFKQRCEICGSRAFGDCSGCGRKVCSRHLASVITYKCKECKKKK
jgi:hypothetical protein